MPATIAQKFRIRENSVLFTVNAPADFKKNLGELPPGVKVTASAKNFDQVHWFVKTKAEMKKDLKKLMSLVKGGVICWIYFPKGTSGIQTDLTRDSGWDELKKQDKQWINLVSFDDTWSAFGLREKTGSDRRKENAPKQKPVSEFVDPKTKTVTIPGDLATAFKKNKKEEAYFHTLAFSHRKEYIEWIVSAKKEETREKRVRSTIEMLAGNRKNPFSR